MEKVSENLSFLFTKKAWIGDPDDVGNSTISLHEVFVPRWPWKTIGLLPWSLKQNNNTSDNADSKARSPPFIGLETPIPILVAALCGFQHSLAMLAGIITPPIILASAVNLDSETQSYMISASLIVSAMLSCVQMSHLSLPVNKIMSLISRGRIKVERQFYIGSGLLTVVGTSFATITTATSIFTSMYNDGTCPTIISEDGSTTKGPCPEAYGYLLGTAALCSLIEIGLSFVPIRLLKKAFPPLITGPVVLLIGASLIQSSGFLNWAGGSGDCAHRPTSGEYVVCPQVGAKHALPWGSPEYLGLGFLSFITIIIVELFGSPVMRNASIVLGLVVGMIVAGPAGYVDGSNITSAKSITFLWTTTFPLKIYAPAILPLLAVYISLMMEAIGDTTATSEVSKVEVDGPEFDSRLQGSILADGLNGMLAALFTVTPMSVFAQNNGVISLTRCANRRAGYWCCVWLLIYGIIGKIAGVFLSIPNSVLGGVTTFLFASVAVSGLRILSSHNMPKTRRERFILAASLSFGLGNLLVSDWAEYLFENASKVGGLPGFESALQIIIETPFIVCALIGIILNTLLPEENDDYQSSPPTSSLPTHPSAESPRSVSSSSFSEVKKLEIQDQDQKQEQV